MKRKFIKYSTLISLSLILFLLAGCTGGPGPTSAAMSQTAPGSLPVVSKLALGTLMLDSSSQAVTAEQAKTLLPLWKAVTVLSVSEYPQEEINAVHTQIQDTMSQEQMASINKMTTEEFQAYAKKAGLPTGAAMSGPQAASGSKSSSQDSGPGGGMMGLEGGGGGPPPGESSSSSKDTASTNINDLYEAVIKLLKEKAVASK